MTGGKIGSNQALSGSPRLKGETSLWGKGIAQLPQFCERVRNITTPKAGTVGSATESAQVESSDIRKALRGSEYWPNVLRAVNETYAELLAVE
jgi:hypothetical protein